LLAHGWWFSLGTTASSTTKTGRHDIVEILLKVTLNTKFIKISCSSIKRYENVGIFSKSMGNVFSQLHHKGMRVKDFEFHTRVKDINTHLAL
jgi:hypothetical protein